jgi:dienelactone hydrolase
MLSRRSFLACGSLALWKSLGRAADSPPKLPTVNEEIRRAAREAPLKMLFQGGSPADVKEWQSRFAAGLRQRIGRHTPPAHYTSTPISTREFDDYTREGWLLKADGFPSLPLYILRPRPSTPVRPPFPVVLCVHGHGPFGHDAVAGIDDTPERAADIKASNYDYGRQFARRGYLVVVPCLTPFGRRLDDADRADKKDPCAVTFVRLMLLGQSLIGANLRDLIWSLDYVGTRPEASKDRIGCAGLSYGGRMTMMVSALDSRIQVAAISGALNAMQERIEGRYSCGAQVIPGLLEIGDTPEIGSLIAPRPCIWEMGSKDSLIPAAWADKGIARMQRAYKAAGKPENLQIHRFDGGHQWSGTTAFPLFDAILKA